MSYLLDCKICFQPLTFGIMATQTGEIQITSIENKTIQGVFTSVYEKNVYSASEWFAIEMIKEGCYHKDLKDSLLSKLEKKDIEKVTFKSPNKSKTNFIVVVKDHIDLTPFTEGTDYWESYMLG